MFYDVYEKRKQIRWYDLDRAPAKEDIETALKQSYELMASKQNLVPFKVYVIEKNKELNQGLYNISQHIVPTTSANHNLLTAPYHFIWTVRISEGNPATLRDITEFAHLQPVMDPYQYKTRETIRNTNIEIGMHACVLTKLLIEKGIDVSYTVCLADWQHDNKVWVDNGFDFIEDEVQFVMSAGYEDPEKYYTAPETKPDYESIVEWI